MEPMVAVGALMALALLVIGAWLVSPLRLRRRGVAAGPEIIGRLARVTLELDEADPALPGVQRLAAEAASRVFATRPDVEEVAVLTRSGRVLARLSRTSPARKMADLPLFLFEPHSAHHVPDLRVRLGEEVVAGLGPGGAHFDSSPKPVPGRPLAEYFDLPDSVKRVILVPDDAVDVVRAILEAAGLRPRVDGELLTCGDRAVVVLRKHVGEVALPEDLNHAYLRFRDSGARTGVVVTPGILYPAEVRRRELMAPALQHAGPEGIQRMADATAIGADPLRFAAAPPLA